VIAEEYKKNKEKYLLLPQKEYLFITRNSFNRDELANLIRIGVKIITFKGPYSKEFIPQTLKELLVE
jgi:hypothetical protein